jgi:catecholate siderophore receptor
MSKKKTRSSKTPWVAMGALVASTSLGVRIDAFRDPKLDRLRFVVPAETIVSWRDDSPAGKQDPPPRRFEIAAGPLDPALEQFARVSGLRIRLADPAIGTIQSPGVSGLLTAEQALKRLLEGTSVGYRFADADVVTLEIAGTTEFVEVTRPRSSASAKLPEPLRDVPQTVNVITAAVMEQQGATTLREVLRNVPGITFQAGEGGVPAGDQLTIRGFSARTDIFVDGVRDFGGYTRDSFNLEQVEVVKGPSSGISGRGSTGGSINQVSKTPGLTKDYDVTLGGGSGDYLRSTIDVNEPIEALPGTAVRLNAMWTDSGVPGRDLVESERWGVAPSIAFGLGSPTRATLSYFHLGQDNLPEYGIPWVPVNTNPELQAYSGGAPPVDQSNFYGLTTRDYEKTDTDMGTLQVDRDFGGAVTLRNVTRVGVTDRDSVITAPRFASVNTSTILNRQLQSRDMEDGIVANQTTVNARVATGRVSHGIVAGAEFTRETSENFARIGPTAPQADLYNPDAFAPYAGPIVRSGASTDATANSAAAFVFDTVNLGSQWELTGGLRWDRFDVETSSIAVGGAVTDFERTDSMVSWRGGVVYKPKPNGSVYTGYSTAFNPSAEGLALTAATAALEPETTENFEVGTKWDVFREKLSLVGAFFRAVKNNARTPGINAGDPPTVLEGEQRVMGVELGASGRIGDRLTLLAGYSAMSSDITESNTPAEIDNALALVPEQTFNIWATYEFPFRLTIGGGAQYMDSVYRNALNTLEVPSYTLVNGLVSYEVNRNLTLRLNANNLGDVDYVDRVGGGHYIPGPGRQVIVGSSIKF